MTSLQSSQLHLLKFFFNKVMERLFDGHLDDVLSRCTEFDHMEGKFIAKKTREQSPRIAKLQHEFGFESGESLNSNNLHRLIPGAKEINNILGKRRCNSPMAKIQEKKSVNQAKLVPHLRIHKARRPTIPAIRRIKGDWKNLSDGEYSSNSSSDSDSKNNFTSSRANKSFDDSFINRSPPYSSNGFNGTKSRKSWDVPKLNKESDFSNFNNVLNGLRSIKDFPVAQLNTPIFERTLNKKNHSSNESINLGELTCIKDDEAVDSSMDLSVLNSDKCLPISALNKNSDESYVNKNILLSNNNLAFSKLNSFKSQSCYSVLAEDLEVSSSEDEKENFHQIVF